ncbi:DapH/DapD/GlmU-related protein [Chryseobacterium gotjawalense]|uniref:DapH/DapD/GlmU-related protein n=1 Tax=Chryseobacterium gotjawalense TaxID=3042315 RepID=A0ABY8RGD4_9FLAO|nr:DapH/DapD/GlmU-related protein [Chryseobacterium sp. wdc7]WHF53045.1 DapH/DapD/GlmU-related protein [Chryseobacterium sp. wdc7]
MKSSILRRYGLWGTVVMFFNLIRTKLLFPKARLIRFPIDVRGIRFIHVSEGFTTGSGCRIEAYPNRDEKVLYFGRNFQMNDYVHITATESVRIGDNVLLASKIYISDCAHGSYGGNQHDSHPASVPSQRHLFSKPVVIEDNVWIGEMVSVLPGVTIGTGSIIGANSVVSKSIPPNVIAVGSPAKPIKKFNFVTKIWEKI